MGNLGVVGILFGMILGQFFKCFVLIPASGLTIILVLANPAHIEHSLLGWFLQIVVLITSLQIGYLVGAVLPAPERSKAPGLGSFDERPSTPAEKCESGRRAA
jgi:hypothetical protein